MTTRIPFYAMLAALILWAVVPNPAYAANCNYASSYIRSNPNVPTYCELQDRVEELEAEDEEQEQRIRELEDEDDED